MEKILEFGDAMQCMRVMMDPSFIDFYFICFWANFIDWDAQIN